MTQAASSELSQELLLLAADGAHTSRSAQLQQLAVAVDGGDDAQLWADTDVLRALDVDGPLYGVVEESPSAKRWEMLRTFLVFCPLIITWAGLYVAGGAYDRLLASKPDASRSAFLKLWLSGFEGRTPFSLDRLALATAALIALLVIASVCLERQRQRDDTRFRTVSNEKRHRLRAAAVQADMALRPFGSGSPERFREEMIRGSAAFGAMAAELQPVASEVRASLQALGDVAKRLESASLYTSLAADRISDSSLAFTAMVPELQRHLVDASSVLTAAVEENGAKVESAMSGGTARMAEHLSTATEEIVKTLNGGSAQLTSQVELSSAWIVGAAEALMTQSDTTLTTASRGYEEVRNAIAAMQTSVEEALGREASTTEVLRAAEALLQESALTRTADGELGEALTCVSGAAGATSHTMREVATHLAEHVELSSSWVVGATEALLSQGEQTLTAASHSYDQVSRSVQALQAHVEEALGREASSTEVLKAAQSLLAEAAAGRTAVSALHDAVTRMSTTAGGIDAAVRESSRHLTTQFEASTGVLAKVADEVLVRSDAVLATAAESAHHAGDALIGMRGQLADAAARDAQLARLIDAAETLVAQAASTQSVTADLVKTAAPTTVSADGAGASLSRAAKALEVLVLAFEQGSVAGAATDVPQHAIGVPTQVAS